MEEGKFAMDTEIFKNEIVEKMKTVCDTMDQAYKDAVSIMENDVKNYEGWKGKQKEELTAFLDLTTQFHKDMSEVKTSPTDAFYKTISTFPDLVEGYNKESSSYKNLEGKD